LAASNQPHGMDRRKYNRRTGVDRRRAERRSGFDRRAEGDWEPVKLEETFTVAYDEAGLVAAAIDARTRARARFSSFQVGAALETSTGVVVTGCNIENATYGLTMCAERVALFKALSDGHDVAVRVVPAAPVGVLRRHRRRAREPLGSKEARTALAAVAPAVRRQTAVTSELGAGS
jgi:hypothetical protein